MLRAELDRAGFREALLALLAKDARFTYKDEVWKVVACDLLSP